MQIYPTLTLTSMDNDHMSTTEQAFVPEEFPEEFRERFLEQILADLNETSRRRAVVPPCLAGPNCTPADPSELADRQQFEETINRALATDYVDRVTAAQDELLGDLDNWRPTGFLGAQRP